MRNTMRVKLFEAGRSALALGVLLLFHAGPARAQTSSAVLQGHVLDQSKAALPGVTVTASSASTGLQRSATTATDGAYRIAGLPVDVYDVKAEISGFEPVEQKGIAVQVASTRTLDFALGVAGMAKEIQVTTEAPLAQPTAAIGTVVSEAEIQNLPLNGRQYANLGALAPGTQLAYNSDPTKPGQLTVALNGGIGRNVNYIIDGGDNTDDTIGGALQNFSIEGVQEFNIQTQQYKAEYGRSTGGVLAVVTKTGTNDFHGSAFVFGRDDALNSQTESESIAGLDAQPYSRKQFGGSVGGPIVKDKAHFFTSYERTNRTTNYTINTPLLPENGESVPLPFEDNLFAAKATYDINAQQYLQVRFGYQKNADKYGASSVSAPSALGTVDNKYHSFLAGHTWTLDNGTLNEFVFQYTKFANSISPDSVEATLLYPNGVTSGQNFNTPQTTNQEKYQFKDDYSFSKVLGGDRHELKTGFNFVHEPTLGGDFSTGVDAPTFTLLENSVGSPVREIAQSGGQFVNSTPVNQYSIYFQDDWKPTERLTMNLGLRYDYWTGFDLDQRTNPNWQVLSTQTTYNEDYLQDFQHGKGGVLENDKNNIAPRIGFTYDTTGEQKHFVRGGFGVYYDFPYTNATILFPTAAVQSDYGTIYSFVDNGGIKNPDGSFFQPGDPLPPNQIVGLDTPVPREIASPTLRTPMSRQASIGYQTELTDWLGMGVDVSTIDYRDIPFRFRMNPIDTATGARRFPDLSPNLRLWYGKGKADYDGMNINMRARVSKKLTMQGFYTLSRVKGNVLAGADEFRVYNNDQPDAPTNQPPSVLDPLCAACIGHLGTDARHKFTLSGNYQAPWDINLGGLFRARSATPYTLYAQADLDGDGYANDLQPGVSHVNTGRGHSFAQFDMRAGKVFRFGGQFGVEAMLEVFNLFNAKNPANFNSDGEPTAFSGDQFQGEQRLAQWGLRFHF